ncbi:MFS transporter [Acuticoccus sediminis]|uniref:MFS transporter n=1 Tax=Acuticoccus sediminis TaxID=2184697 RepID=UPI001CFE802D|nr:MFS transporter [Acuticoccus sediminis]
MPFALVALALGAFGIGLTEFVIMGLLVEVADGLSISVTTAGTLISGYALGVVVGAPVITIFTRTWPQKRTLLLLMAIFVVGNAACALAPSYETMMAARILTALTHGTFFGVGSIVAQRLVPKDRQASAIAIVFTGLTLANVLGVPFGTFLGQMAGWRTTFWAVSAIGILAGLVMLAALPGDGPTREAEDNGWRSDLAMLTRGPVLRGLAMTVFGYAGVFAVFTYIAPYLTAGAGFPPSAVAPILLGFGAGLVLGNLVGGRLADHKLGPTIVGTLAVLALVLVAMAVAVQSQVAAALATALLGAASFATVAPLQAWVMARADGAGQALAASVNIAAFNLGNAIGAWAGGLVIAAGFSYAALPLAAALFPLAALGIGLVTIRRDAVPAAAVGVPS